MREARAGLLALALLAGCGGPGSVSPPPIAPPVSERPTPAVLPPAYRTALALLEEFVRAEMEEKHIPALAIALVDGGRVVWAGGFGSAITAETPWRVGSVSKPITDIALMQLVEERRVELDAPVSRYLRELSPRSPAGRATLRQLMTHRAGIVREPPVGHYFDDSSPSLAATVASLDSAPAVYPPGEQTKYSNAGIAAVGLVVERVTGRPFADHVRERVLRPAGMARADFLADSALHAAVPAAWMWAYDRPEWPAPSFPLATAPAGGLYASVGDLGRLIATLLSGGAGPGGRILARATLDSMWTVQLPGAEVRTGFGLGFLVTELDGLRRIGHGGWIYGFGTELAALPDERLGVAVAANVDGSNAVLGRIADRALRLALAARGGGPLPATARTQPVPAELARRVEGRYGDGRRWVELDESGGDLALLGGEGGLRRAMRRLGDTLVTDGRLHFGTRVRPLWVRPGGDEPPFAIALGDETLVRLRDAALPPPPARGWEELIGEYGWAHDVLYVLERAGRLHLLIEWFFYEPLEPAGPDRFRLRAGGLYAGETVEPLRDGEGRVRALRVGGVVFPRRDAGPGEGQSFRIVPLRPVEELRPAALAADPPAEEGSFRPPELVELRSLDPTIRYDIRYAGENNFMGARFYHVARALLQRPAAEAVVRAHRTLARRGFGLLVHDAYRPWHVTRMFWDATPDSLRLFVADPARGSRHNRGAAVDLTLFDVATGEPVAMPSGYDEFTERASADYPGGTERQRALRELLREAMEAEGFEVYPAEWWHFDYREWREYPILDLALEELPGGG